MEWVQFRGRRAVQVETDQLRMTVTQEGGHIAELLHKDTAISPLWVPEWPSLEPSAYSPVRHPEYGGGPEATNELYISCVIGPSGEVADNRPFKNYSIDLLSSLRTLFTVP
jgi:hypothetical protein